MTERETFLAERRKGIGGSDAPVILGLSKWQTPLGLWREKRGLVGSQPDNQSMRLGRLMEPVVRDMFREETGVCVTEQTAALWHPKHSFMLAHVDGLTDRPSVLEIKTARSSRDWGEPGSDEIPAAYLAQVQHYMAVTGFVVCDVAVLFGGSDFAMYQVPADAEAQEMIIDAEAAFWDMVVRGIEPEPVSLEEVNQKFTRSIPESVEATPELIEAVARQKGLKAQISELEADEKVIEATIKRALGDKEALTFEGRPIATWKSDKKGRDTLDKDALKAAHPDIYQQFVRTSEPIRRYLLKGN